MRRAAKVDRNHSAVVEALRSATMRVTDLSAVGEGCPDLLVGWRGINVLLEIKDGEKVASKRQLTAAQKKWHEEWAGQAVVVETPEQAVCAVVEEARKRGVV